MKCEIEQGPIRPPSEARSLLIRVSRNCPWNKCTFCHTYRGTRFELRSLADIKRDVETVASVAAELRDLSAQQGQSGKMTAETLHAIANNPHYNDFYHSVAAWLYFGGTSVFLQDGNSLVMKTDELVELLQFIREKFPHVNRVTSYCRAKTAARKSPEDFKRLHAAGLTRIHIGLETGYAPLLDFVHKGVTVDEQITGGRNIKESGISLSEYVMPGLGGVRWSREHAVQTARVLNQINPDYIRLRSFQPVPGTEIYEAVEKGEHELLDEDGVVREIRLFIETLDGIDSRIASDHIMNLLEEIDGKLPEDRDCLLGVADRYLGLSDDDRAVFILGRRCGLYRKLDDLSNPVTYREIKGAVDGYRLKGPEQFERDLARIRRRFI